MNAIGVAVVLVASLTLLPALLTLFGRRAFWPTARSVAFAPEEEGETANRAWRRFAGAVRRRPAAWLALGVALLVAAAFGTLTLKSNMSPVAQFRKATDATRGYEVLRSAFPAGALAPTTVLVERGDGPVRPADLASVERRIRAVGGVRAVQDAGRRSRDGRVAQLNVVFADDPFREPALNRIGDLRSALHTAAGPSVQVLVGQGSGERVDYRAGAWRDAKVIGPLVLAVVLLTLVLLLRAAVAPLYLLVTVILSFLGSLGAALLVFRLLGQGAGVDPLIPLLIFIFLVALGSDYNIFLMSRAREEAARHGTAEGTFRAVVATGPVITSAGLILAGTFSILTVLPVWPLAEVGLGVALGVLVDTFLVRSICVPAVAWLLGERIWWPARAAPAEELRPVPTLPSA